MAKRKILRLLVVALVVAVALLGMHAISHWHANSYDERHCQVCQMGHAAIPQPAAQVAAQMPVLVARFAPAEEAKVDLEPVHSLSIPRAPPA